MPRARGVVVELPPTHSSSLSCFPVLLGPGLPPCSSTAFPSRSSLLPFLLDLFAVEFAYTMWLRLSQCLCLLELCSSEVCPPSRVLLAGLVTK